MSGLLCLPWQCFPARPSCNIFTYNVLVGVHVGDTESIGDGQLPAGKTQEGNRAGAAMTEF